VRAAAGFGLALLILRGAPALAEDRAVYVPAVDYPAGVPASDREYLVRVRYELDAAGRIARCAIAHASGEPSLDAETCRILQSRARIRPEGATMRGIIVFHWLPAGRLPPDAADEAPPRRGDPLSFNLAAMVSDADYPRAARARNESGTVVYEVAVSPLGVPRACTVFRSSGSESLDRRTCDIVMQRSAFIAATDGAGPVAGIAHGRIRWMFY
jgi:TonB family protein